MKTTLITIILTIAVCAGIYLIFGKSKVSVQPTIAIDGGILKLIDARASHRDFSTKEINDKTMNEILWSAFGKNSHGTRTIPTSRNRQALSVYAITSKGAFLYDGEKMIKVSDKDLRPLFAHTVQSFPKTAPLTILYAGDDTENSPLHAGSAMQNVGLYATEKGLGQVVRMMFDKDAVSTELHLPKGTMPIVSQTIGWQK